jgi:glycosyltransferase involved in cell wall biosynthesis
MINQYTIGLIIPCYKVKAQILKVISGIDEYIDYIYIIDDKCPEKSGEFVLNNIKEDPRLKVIFNKINLGVGGAVKEGYKNGIKDNCDILVKVDGDGQMDPNLIKSLIQPIINGEADYVKGNRFYYLGNIKSMPKIRLIGNSILSFINKIVNGYWNIMDPTNGFTAIHTYSLKMLPLHKIDNRYFFESDMLFRLGTIRAVVKDFSIKAVYADENSSLKISKILIKFPLKYLNRFFKRLFYVYVLRDFNVGTLQLMTGSLLILFSFIFGILKWIESINTGIPASSGTVMVAALPFFLGFQLLIAALYFDIQNTPSKTLFNKTS